MIEPHYWGAAAAAALASLVVDTSVAARSALGADVPLWVGARQFATATGDGGVIVDWFLRTLSPIAARAGSDPLEAQGRVVGLSCDLMLTAWQEPDTSVDARAITAFGAAIGAAWARPVWRILAPSGAAPLEVRLVSSAFDVGHAPAIFDASDRPLAPAAGFTMSIIETADAGRTPAGPGGIVLVTGSFARRRLVAQRLAEADAVVVPVSAWASETAESLRVSLEAASAAGSTLLVDEADAIFGRRTEVRDAHDRFANLPLSRLAGRVVVSSDDPDVIARLTREGARVVDADEEDV